jgi:hypothetical protein
MSTFEFISVLLSTVVGLGLTRLLTGVGRAMLLLGIPFLGACGQSAHEDPSQVLGREEHEITASPEVMITTESGVIGEVSDVLVGEGGAVFLSDPQASVVHRILPGSGFAAPIGRPGAGPGELRLPGSMAFLGDTLAVVDLQNGRVQFYSPEGDALGSRPLPPDLSPVVGPTLGPSGDLILPTVGRDSALAIVYFENGQERLRIGRSSGERWTQVDERELRQEVVDGKLPSLLLNLSLPVPAQDGTIWLVLQSQGVVERYDRNGSRTLSVSLSEPEFGPIEEDFIKKNRDADPEFPGIYALRYFVDAWAAEPGLWLLLTDCDESPATILLLSEEGRVAEEYRFLSVSGATRFAVDTEGCWVYFVIGEEAEVVRVPLSAGRQLGMCGASRSGGRGGDSQRGAPKGRAPA